MVTFLIKIRISIEPIHVVMKNTRAMLLDGFESSSGTTPEFKAFYQTFKREFTRELMSIGATNVQFNRGHFYVSGFFTSATGQIYYFSLSDVRGMDYTIMWNPDSCMAQLLYRTADSYKDFTGGMNQYVPIGEGMALNMNVR